MTSQFTAAIARPHQGDGLILRRGGVLAVVAAAGHSGTTDALTRICLDIGESGGDGRRLARKLAGFLTDDPPDVPAFAALGISGDSLVIFVYGAAEVSIAGDVISGRESPTWVDRVLPWPVQGLSATVPGAGSASPSPADLRDGVVTGGGVTVEVEPQRDAPATGLDEHVDHDPAPSSRSQDTSQMEAGQIDAGQVEPGPMDAGPMDTGPVGSAVVEVHEPPAFESVILWTGEPEPSEEPVDARQSVPLPESTDGDQSHEAAVVVQGVVCKNEHLNDPRMYFCGVCGINMVQQTPVLTEGPRPPLGVLVLDDGSVFQLDANYVLGRDPEHDEGVRTGRYRSLTLSDTDRTLSRAHARIELRNWDVVIVDNGSANGTEVAEGDRPWTALAAGSPHTLGPGARVRMGARTLVFNTHRAL